MTSSTSDNNAPSLLDPQDWKEFRESAHQALDVALDFAQQRPSEPVWQELPPRLKQLDEPLPQQGRKMSELVLQLQQDLLPYTLGNNHPKFWGWVHGSGTAGGIVAQTFIGAVNANMGGRDHAPMYIEQQLIRWLVDLFGFPAAATGLMCSGTSNATLLGLSVARHRALGRAVRTRGNQGQPLMAYCSGEVHISVSKALELLGLGSDCLRQVATGSDFALDTDNLAAMIAQDLDSGLQPFVVISSVGSVNTGSIDDLQRINEICAENQLWHHVDGAIGALTMLSEKLKPRLLGIEGADSIALDFHKWLHVNYAAGALLVRDGALHKDTFSNSPEYLVESPRGVAGGAPWPCDYGIELSRGFGALAVWMQFMEHGSERLGLAMERNCAQASEIAQQIEAHEMLQLMAPVTLNIVCFRYCVSKMTSAQCNALNRQIVEELHCQGLAVPSVTLLQGDVVIRICLTNHRTRSRHLSDLLQDVCVVADELLHNN